ncbi:MAG: hypothetical protein IPK68_17440 [Bdellovibrionales bacterium]|nr:hypothetical protein [Bdellovibrionales bacterium]
MIVTKLREDNLLIETNGKSVLTLFGSEKACLSDLSGPIGKGSPPDILIFRGGLDDQRGAEGASDLLSFVLDQLPGTGILVLGQRAYESSFFLGGRRADKVHYLSPFQFLRIHDIQFMWVPAEIGGGSVNWTMAADKTHIWFQWPYPSHPEVSRFARIFNSYPFSAVYTKVADELLRRDKEAYNSWIQSVLGARTQIIFLGGKASDTQLVTSDFKNLDSRLQIYQLKEKSDSYLNENLTKEHLYPLYPRNLVVRGSVSAQKNPCAPTKLAKQDPLGIRRRYLYTPEQEKALIERLIEVEFHSRILKTLREESESPFQEIVDSRAVLQVEIKLSNGPTCCWTFSHLWPRFEINFNPHPEPRYTFRYSAAEILDFVWDSTQKLNYSCTDSPRAGWQPLEILNGIWGNSVANPLIDSKEKDLILYGL